MVLTRWPRLLGGVVFIFGCQHIDDVDVGSPEMPAATAEMPRINIDEIGPKVVRHTGVAPVTPSLADPAFTLPRVQTTAFEDPAPPEPPRPLTVARTWYLGLTGAERNVVRQICREGRRDPCFGMLPPPRGSGPTKMDQLLAQLGTNGQQARHQVHQFCREENPRLRCDTPLVVAFDDQPVVFEASSTTFAFQPGVPVHTDWPSAATPWIALDRDGDGAITSGAELFGDATVLPDGSKAEHGFAALAALDDNGDGVIDREDPMFSRLVLWTDRDRDRKSSHAELRPLSEVIDALPLAHQVSARCTQGNCEGETAVMHWRDDRGRTRTGAVIDVYLRRRF